MYFDLTEAVGLLRAIFIAQMHSNHITSTFGILELSKEDGYTAETGFRVIREVRTSMTGKMLKLLEYTAGIIALTEVVLFTP